MKATTIFRALLTARDEMERDLSDRAEYGFMIPVTPTRARFGIAISDDRHARSWQRHKRQVEKFETRIRIILSNLEQLQKLTFTLGEAESLLKLRKMHNL